MVFSLFHAHYNPNAQQTLSFHLCRKGLNISQLKTYVCNAILGKIKLYNPFDTKQRFNTPGPFQFVTILRVSSGRDLFS